jgi:hypothetical protein
MILEEYWQAFISLAARDCLVSTELRIVHAACVEVAHVYFHDMCVLPCINLHWVRGRRLRGITSGANPVII